MECLSYTEGPLAFVDMTWFSEQNTGDLPIRWSPLRLTARPTLGALT